MRYLRTAELAKAAGVHPNTIRLYESWGFLPPVERGMNDYRLYTQAHLNQVKLIRMVLRSTWLSGEIRHTGLAIIQCGAAGNLKEALNLAHHLADLLQSERDHAEAAINVLENWVASTTEESAFKPLKIREAAALLNVSEDKLRNWERNGLIEVPRLNRIRLYGSAEMNRLRVIRTLRSARYSTMSILKMLNALEQDRNVDLREALDTHEDNIYYTTDRWLVILIDLQATVQTMITHLEMMQNT